MEKEIIRSFAPVINENCEILFLGSLPSRKSREEGFYYGHPQNRFWKIMSALFKEDFTAMTAKEKAAAMLKNRAALFDVYSSGEIKKGSSMDGDIKNPRFNDIEGIVCGTRVKKIYITSKKAYTDFIKRFEKKFNALNIKIINLPSPSAANRGKFKTDGELVDEWIRILKED